jgi:hypothetical protein
MKFSLLVGFCFCFVVVDLYYVTLILISLHSAFHINQKKKPEYPKRTTDHGEATDKLYHLRLRVKCTLFVIFGILLSQCIYDIWPVMKGGLWREGPYAMGNNGVGSRPAL